MKETGNIFQGVTKGDVLRYMLTPQVMPRIRSFYQSGFGHLAYMIALVYRAVNILPADHAILRPENRHDLGLRNVLAAAGAQLSFTKQELDKTIIYFVVLIGLILLAVQFFITLGYVMMNPALAQMPENYEDFFAPAHKKDIAYNLLFTVFGVPELFRPGAARSEFHAALHSLFQFYSIGLLVIAVIIVCYFIFAVLVETAQTGVPFGKRYVHTWVPLRFVMALGLLIPIGYGLNASQWIALYSAKFGSDFATKGWLLFNEKMEKEYLDNPEQRVGTPQAPELMPIVGQMMVVNACDYAYTALYEGRKKMSAYLIKNTPSAGPAPTMGSKLFKDSHDYFDKGDIVIRFGERNETEFSKEPGYVYPYCGEIVIRTSDTGEPGSLYIQEYYYKLIRDLYLINKYQLVTHGENFIKKYAEEPRIRDNDAPLPASNYKAETAKSVSDELLKTIKEAVDKQSKSPTWEAQKKLREELGWAAAGVEYNKIAQINGSLVTAVRNIPEVRRMPQVMEYMRSKQLQENMAGAGYGSAQLANQQEIPFETPMDRIVGNGLNRVYNYWAEGDTREDAGGNKTRQTANIFIDTINLIFGTRGLFDMCASADVHPLAQLSTLGKGLVEASIRNVSLGLLAGIGGALPIPFLGAALGAASTVLISIASITLTMGFMMFYVLPFMPFLYFFFAVGGWIKGLFEAMVGVPLWALAHLRIDGEGLPGDAAMDGIYLIFEIFIRPLLIIFGLLASVIIFAAMVKILNEIFALVVVNLAGHDPNTASVCGKSPGTSSGGGSGGSVISFFRGPIDELFFTVMYAIIVYMIGMSCFKLIDLVPNNILRYMGARVNTFNDAANDPADGLMMRLSIGTTVVSQKVLGGGNSIVGSAIGAARGGIKGATEIVNPPQQPGGQ